MAGKAARTTMLFIVALFIQSLLLAGPRRLRAEVTIQDPGTYVVDRANVLSAQQRQAISGWLRELEQKTTTQIKVLTVPSTGDEDIFTFTQRHYDLWKLGQRGKDNGALIVLAPDDRKVRIHTGYGLEGVLPDSYCGSLSREAAARFFKQGKYGDGLYFIVIAVANKVADDAHVKLTGMPDIRHRPRKRRQTVVWFPCCLVLVLLFFSMLGGGTRGRRRRSRRGWGGSLFEALLWGSVLGGGRGRSTWGGGSSGFGGGLGGGFGGSFGGGGMSGGGGGGASW